jgi:hypothetical protein
MEKFTVLEMEEQLTKPGLFEESKLWTKIWIVRCMLNELYEGYLHCSYVSSQLEKSDICSEKSTPYWEKFRKYDRCKNIFHVFRVS